MNVKRLALLGLSAVLLAPCATAQAGWHIGIGIGVPVYRPYCYRPYYGVYVAPAPVYVQPVYVQPAPVYVQPAPAYVPAQPAVAVPAVPAPQTTYAPPPAQSNYAPAPSTTNVLPAQPVPIQ